MRFSKKQVELGINLNAIANMHLLPCFKTMAVYQSSAPFSARMFFSGVHAFESN